MIECTYSFSSCDMMNVVGIVRGVDNVLDGARVAFGLFVEQRCDHVARSGCSLHREWMVAARQASAAGLSDTE